MGHVSAGASRGTIRTRALTRRGHPSGFGRAAARLHMSQPPLSRAIKQLETDVGAVLLHRSPAGVTLTRPGITLLDEARTLLGQADRVRVRVAAGTRATLTL